jgi:hypothetical protein
LFPHHVSPIVISSVGAELTVPCSTLGMGW